MELCRNFNIFTQAAGVDRRFFLFLFFFGGAGGGWGGGVGVGEGPFPVDSILTGLPRLENKIFFQNYRYMSGF